jgi:integrase
MRVHRIPKYRHFKPKNLGLVVIGGRQHYLGRYGTPESVAEYKRLIQELLATETTSRTVATGVNPGLTVDELLLAFWTRHAETHYRGPDGSPTGELDNYRDSLRPLRRLYGGTPARDFSPLKLKAVRNAMIDDGLSRGTINQRVGRVVRVFKWAASEELVPAAVYQALRTVSGLPRGRSEAREPEPVRPVPDASVDAVKPHVSAQVGAMVELQRLTGMRPGEVCIMRTGDIDRTGPVWFYAPRRHKTEHHGRSRRVAIGPRAQEVLKPWLRADPEAYLFSPAEAMTEFRSRQRGNRKTPLYPSQEARARKPNPKKTPGERYTTRSYCHAIGYGCKRAGIPTWSPNRLRHAAATKIRATHDLDAARAVLGHSDLKTSEIYAERDREEAARVMREIG